MTFTDDEHQTLQELALRGDLPVSKVVTGIVRAFLKPNRAEGAERAAAAAAAVADAPRQPVPTSPLWLPPLDRSARADWARLRVAAIEALCDRYSVELSELTEGWAGDAPVREQLWAMSVWRDQLDAGIYDDPRMELSFARAMSDFAVYLRERPRRTMQRRY